MSMVTSGIGFEPTYEELKLKAMRVTAQWSMGFWAYLWGIETYSLHLVFSLTPVFWAYLWGIETQSAVQTSHIMNSSFEPTYEELKLPYVIKESVYIPCFEPTYEELKRWEGLVSRPYHSCFEPTYEELKP